MPRKPPPPTPSTPPLPLEAKPRKSPLVSKSRKPSPKKKKKNNNNNNRFWKHPPNNWSQKHPTTAAAAANKSLQCTYTLYWGPDTEESLLKTLEKEDQQQQQQQGTYIFDVVVENKEREIEKGYCSDVIVVEKRERRRERERRKGWGSNKLLAYVCAMSICFDENGWNFFCFPGRWAVSQQASFTHTHTSIQGNFLLNPLLLLFAHLTH